jgi:hypothetical protein
LAVKNKEEDGVFVLSCPAETEFEIVKMLEDKPLDGSMGAVTIEKRLFQMLMGMTDNVWKIAASAAQVCVGKFFFFFPRLYRLLFFLGHGQ